MHPESMFGWPTRTDNDPARVALLLPGRAYVPARPLLHYAKTVLTAHGWTTQEVWWQPPDLPPDDYPTWVIDQVTRYVEQEVDARRVLLVGKSLASFAASVAADRDLPAIWLTPLLHHPQVTGALRRAKARTLLVGGTADTAWKSEVARSLPVEHLEVPGADHGLETRNPVGSAEVLARVTAAMESFVRNL
ncbi:hypothetical protein OHA25_44015 [Nonomuraea sp. NBC_00507]|uniref:hypothetical protein n=1 Tax=Nonomuraea sp. NBC_00507 TaxID=2976002 RepID=UPI002E19EE68